MTLAAGLQSRKDGIDLVQHLGVVELQDPALLAQGILIEDPQVEGLLCVGAASAPGLEGSVLGPGLLVEVVSIENQRLSLGIEDPAIGFLGCSIRTDIVDLRYIKVPGSHQIPDVAVVAEEFLLLINGLFAVAQQAGQDP